MFRFRPTELIYGWMTLLVLGFGFMEQAWAVPITQAELNPSNTFIDFETLSFGPQSNPLTISGARFSSPTILNITDITSISIILADEKFPTLNGGRVLVTVTAPDLNGFPYVDTTIEFDQPVSEIGFGWGDPNLVGNVLSAFAGDGSLLEQVTPALHPAGGCCASFVGLRRSSNEIAKVLIHTAAPHDWYWIDHVSFGRLGPFEVEVEPGALWPPDHKMSAVDVSIDVNLSPLVLLSATVRSDEPDDAPGNGDGNTTGDTVGLDGFSAPIDVLPLFTLNPITMGYEATLLLRAERSGQGDGRNYTIKVLLVDGDQNQFSATRVVTVPRDQATKKK